VTLDERHEMCGVLASQMHFGKLIYQRVDFVAGEFLFAGIGEHGYHAAFRSSFGNGTTEN
jgi:hypothetical protein